MVDYIYYPSNETANVHLIGNGDRLAIGAKNYDVIHAEDETGAGLAPVIYLRRQD